MTGTTSVDGYVRSRPQKEASSVSSYQNPYPHHQSNKIYDEEKEARKENKKLWEEFFFSAMTKRITNRTNIPTTRRGIKTSTLHARFFTFFFSFFVRRRNYYFTRVAWTSSSSLIREMIIHDVTRCQLRHRRMKIARRFYFFGLSSFFLRMRPLVWDRTLNKITIFAWILVARNHTEKRELEIVYCTS
ncbi:hypothetical protein ASPZODRAFT_680192 [Penicilliopsis zonata CBS 506.65]|uniref:Uncharacterized protein n=1 Tax=Penicilliopsis zonata CBS 506.65 TaxID=1073090 RepID=A0A1L9SBK6_9EURO|nr:hypothetical protein ASPZODRAFT_680192 [Penicilliopsis zonata CBS 506.65]OJJ44509.1 hypothetical protein ASPZODRAFT_680192 [Penicilliopsis zonata CBS 506.65]